MVSYHFTKEELEGLWKSHNATLKELEQPAGTYSRNLSDLIRLFRDISENLILSGAIADITEQCDVASYVKKKLKERNIPLDNSNFYKYFSPEQKREWQTEEPKKYNSSHIHDWLDIGNTPQGLMKKCHGSSDSLCGAIMIDGKVYQYMPEDVADPEIPKKKNIPQINEKILPAVEAFQKGGDNLHYFAGKLKSHSHLLTDEQIKGFELSIFLMNKAGDFLMKTALDKKEIIDPNTLHLLALAYGEATQKVAAGIFVMNKLDLIGRRNSQGVRLFKQMGEFSKLISEKQTKKAMEGKIKSIHERYQPTSEKDAMDCGFSGQQCENCEHMRIGYRTHENKNYNKNVDPVHMKSTLILQCYDCNHIPKRKIYKLPKEAPLVSVEWNS